MLPHCQTYNLSRLPPPSALRSLPPKKCVLWFDWSAFLNVIKSNYFFHDFYWFFDSFQIWTTAHTICHANMAECVRIPEVEVTRACVLKVIPVQTASGKSTTALTSRAWTEARVRISARDTRAGVLLVLLASVVTLPLRAAKRTLVKMAPLA